MLRIFRVDRAGPERRLGVAGRVDQCRDVTAGGQHVAVVLAAEQARAAIGGLPRGDVVGDAADDVGVGGDLAQVDRAAQHADRAGGDQRVAQPHQHHVAVQRGGHPGGVGVPEQHVERRRLAALHVVVHHVPPHQVGGPQPGEHLRHVAAVEVALPAETRIAACAARSLIAAAAKPARVSSSTVTAKVEARDPVALADLAEVGRGHRREDAARAGGEQVGAVGACDLLHRVHCLDDRRRRRRRNPNHDGGPAGCATK